MRNKILRNIKKRKIGVKSNEKSNEKIYTKRHKE